MTDPRSWTGPSHHHGRIFELGYYGEGKLQGGDIHEPCTTNLWCTSVVSLWCYMNLYILNHVHKDEGRGKPFPM